MTLMEAIQKFRERCESNPRFQEIKEKLIAHKNEATSSEELQKMFENMAAHKSEDNVSE